MRKIGILQVGMGPLGLMLSRFICERKNMRIVGAVDSDPSLKGVRLDELGSVQVPGIRVTDSIQEALRGQKADAAVLSTVSEIEQIVPQLLSIISCGKPVVTTCEELAYPWEASPGLAVKIDREAKAKKVAVLATGVNPGFLMDTLPITLTAVCQRVDAIRVTRVQNAAYRRLPFQKKIGAGLDMEEFEKKRSEGTLRHVGLVESIHMIASRMGWKLDRTEDELEPICAEERIVTETMIIEPGKAAGLLQIGKGYIKRAEKITLTFRATVGEPEPYDLVEIVGEPHLVSNIKGGVNGDIATCAIVLNAVERILQSGPGLKTMVDIPPVSYFTA